MFSKLTELLLEKRGIGPLEYERFLHPDFSRDLADASTMKGMAEAVARLKKAIGASESILVFGDYDADGVPATALLIRALKRVGGKVEGIIPTREQGYGLSAESVEEIVKRKPDVLITVDNGTVSKEEIQSIASTGIHVIVCDHHEPQEGMNAEAVVALINPKQADCPYPFKELCACGLAWRLAEQLYKSLGEPVDALKWELDLVALSTIADMVPLLGENRVLARFGLVVLQKSRNPGIRALAESAGMKLEGCKSGDVGFKLAPRINAPSRMHAELVDEQNIALRLLVGEDPSLSRQDAQYLSKQNSERQELVESHLSEADEQAHAQKEQSCLVVYGASWSTGVIGLVAGRLMEKFRRPVIALAPEGDDIKGSVRTVDGINAVEMLEACSQQLERFGGHSKAAGLTLKSTVGEFQNEVWQWSREQASVEELKERAERVADAEAYLEDITVELCADLADLEPFGAGFPTPVFSAECSFSALRLVGSGRNHLSCFLVQGDIQKKAIGFSWGDRHIEEGKRYRVLFTVSCDEWQGVKSAVCYLKSASPIQEES